MTEILELPRMEANWNYCINLFIRMRLFHCVLTISRNSDTAPKVAPKILSGGFVGWNYFISSSKELSNGDWVEIGVGHGIRPFASNLKSNTSLPSDRLNLMPSPAMSGHSNTSSPNPSSAGMTYSPQPMGGLQSTSRQPPAISSKYSNNVPSNQQMPPPVSSLYTQQPVQHSTYQYSNLYGKPMNNNNQQKQPEQPIKPDQSNPQQKGAIYPTRTSSINTEQGENSARKSLTRKDLFNDPFLGRGGPLYPEPNAPTRNPYSGLSNPMVSLPTYSSGETGNAQIPQQKPSLMQKPAYVYENAAAVSYPKAYSRSPSPDLTLQNNASSDFEKRYPSVESLAPPLKPPPVLPPKPSLPARNQNAASSESINAPNYNNVLANNVASPPILPPKPIVAARTPSAQSLTNDLNQLNLRNGPPPPLLPQKTMYSLLYLLMLYRLQPRESPPLPIKPRPAKLDTAKPVIIRGQHPFILPTSPVGHKFGISGLRNLGNTCFMNSILQCLSATYPFSRYFMDGSYRKHISRNNPLSSHGRVAESYSSVIRNLWLAEESVVVPSDFKNIMGSINPTFGGNEQQDSQEFLSLLLDQLHEDLNVARRPFPPNGPELDSEDYSPSAFMMMEWKKYQARNWSIIVDMFQGVLQSVLQCLTCGKVIFDLI